MARIDPEPETLRGSPRTEAMALSALYHRLPEAQKKGPANDNTQVDREHSTSYYITKYY